MLKNAQRRLKQRCESDLGKGVCASPHASPTTPGTPVPPVPYYPGYPYTTPGTPGTLLPLVPLVPLTRFIIGPSCLKGEGLSLVKEITFHWIHFRSVPHFQRFSGHFSNTSLLTGFGPMLGFACHAYWNTSRPSSHPPFGRCPVSSIRYPVWP